MLVFQRRRLNALALSIIIIIIIIINEKINVAFSRRTARTRNSHKKHIPAVCLFVRLSVRPSVCLSCLSDRQQGICLYFTEGGLMH